MKLGQLLTKGWRVLNEAAQIELLGTVEQTI